MASQKNLKYESERLETFKFWPLDYINKELLARIGLYYESPPDFVKCYFCKVRIGLWRPGDNPVYEHRLYGMDCDLMLGRPTDNIPISQELFNKIIPTTSYDECGILSYHRTHYDQSINEPNLSNIRNLSTYSNTSTSFQSKNKGPRMHWYEKKQERLDTFTIWPVALKQKPEELAEAGFYYSNRSDEVTCFYCGTKFNQWREHETPWEKHALIAGYCYFVKMKKGDDFIKKIQERKTIGDDTSKNPNEQKTCVICNEHKCNTTFYPCEHSCTCVRCTTKVSNCYICEKRFNRIVIYYP